MCSFFLLVECVQDWVCEEVFFVLMDIGIYSIRKEKILFGFFEYCFVKVEQLKVLVLEKNIVFVCELMVMLFCFDFMFYQMLVVLLINLIIGYDVIFLLVIEEYYYIVVEVGEKIGVSVNKIGCIVNVNNFKIEQYGKFFFDKFVYFSKQVEVFCYNVEGVKVLCYFIYGVDVV